jgi:hypothetical protein
MGIHEQAREELTNAWINEFGEAPELASVQIVQAVALGEGGYGRASYKNAITGESAVINNWGAIHGSTPGTGDYWVGTDTHADGKVYETKFRRYPTPQDGANDYVHTLLVHPCGPETLNALSRRSTDAFVEAMKQKGYFELGLEKYQAAVWKRVNQIAAAIGEPVLVTREDSGELAEGGGGPPLGPFCSGPSGSACSDGERGSSVRTGSDELDDAGYPYVKGS